MELRLLQYFLAVAREESISAAAQSLHISQPALSTQLKALEEELGKQLLIRGTKGSRRVMLTEEGMLLRKRAEEILSLVRRAEEEITGLHCSIQLGSLEVTAGEDFGVSELNGSGYEAYIEDGIYVVNGSMTRENHIVVTVPADFLFQTVALTVNGGVLNVQNIHTQTLLTNCDKGGLHFSGSVEGDAEIQHLHGETALTLQGTQTDFNYELDYELGHIGVGKKQYAGANGGESVDNQSDKTMRIHCTMGSVSVLFSDIL